MTSGNRETPIIRQATRWLPWAGAGLLAGMSFWAPLPFASVQPWAETVLRLAAALALALSLPALTDRRTLAPVTGPALALLGVAALGALQSLALPAALVAALSPAHAETYAAASELLPEDGGPAPPGSARLTLSPEATSDAALAWAAAAAALVAAALAGRSRRRRRWLAAGILAAAAFQLLYGVRHQAAEARTIWGITVTGVAERLRGTFVNPNDLAYLFEIGLAVAFAWSWWGIRRGLRRKSAERLLLLGAPPAALWIALFVALAFTRSRAGLLAASAATLLQCVLLALPRRRWGLAATGLGLIAAGAAVAASLTALPVFERLFSTSVYEVAWGARSRVAGLSFDLWRSFPWTGTGLGTFGDAFVRVQPAGFGFEAWTHAHNDYAELLVTGGLVAVALAAWGAAALAARLLQVQRDGLRSEDRAAGLAGLGALAAVAVHEAFDFGLAIPAIAFTLAIVCGAAAAAVVEPRRQRRRRRVRTRDRAQLHEVEAGGGADLDHQGSP